MQCPDCATGYRSLASAWQRLLNSPSGAKLGLGTEAGRAALPHDRVISGQQWSIADPPAFRCHEHAAAPIRLKGKRRPGVVDEASDLLLEVGSFPPNPDVDEGGPTLAELPHHPGELLPALHPVEELGYKSRAVWNGGTSRPVLQELVLLTFLDPPFDCNDPR
jgi:hypothetical protein